MGPSESDKKAVRVTILDRPYTLLGTGESGEIEELAQKVDDLMGAISIKAGNADSTRVAVLACLHLADQLRGLERELHDLRERVERESRRYSSLLGEAIESGKP